MHYRFILAALAFCSLLVGASHADDDTRQTVTRGWLEFVWIPAVDLKLDAKLDTGAKTSSIHAEILDVPDRKDFKAGEGQTVTFRLINEYDETRQMTAPITRWAAIKKKSGGALYRPVVEMTFCLAGVLVDGEVTLANRGHFNYETLIGRNMLKKANLIVDAGSIYTHDSRCGQ